jgi:hypothetical protein
MGRMKFMVMIFVAVGERRLTWGQTQLQEPGSEGGPSANTTDTDGVRKKPQSERQGRILTFLSV